MDKKQEDMIARLKEAAITLLQASNLIIETQAEADTWYHHYLNLKDKQNKEKKDDFPRSA